MYEKAYLKDVTSLLVTSTYPKLLSITNYLVTQSSDAYDVELNRCYITVQI
jgi:hypothetical protein